MDEKTLHLRYGRYFEAIMEVASKSFEKPLRIYNNQPRKDKENPGQLIPAPPPQPEDVVIKRSLIQTGYRDRETDKFDGELIYYFCWLSMQHILLFWKKTDGSLKSLQSLLKQNEQDARNLIRLIQIYPTYVSEVAEIAASFENRNAQEIDANIGILTAIMFAVINQQAKPDENKWAAFDTIVDRILGK